MVELVGVGLALVLVGVLTLLLAVFRGVVAAPFRPFLGDSSVLLAGWMEIGVVHASSGNAGKESTGARSSILGTSRIWEMAVPTWGRRQYTMASTLLRKLMFIMEFMGPAYAKGVVGGVLSSRR